ncbi:MAG: hypothetical protein ACE5H8_01850 [Alphaproteobacteria bacterium]
MAVTELHKRQRSKNFALAGALFALVLLFFAITIVKLGGGS